MYSNTYCCSCYNGSDLVEYSTSLYQNKAIVIIKKYNFKESSLFLYLPFQAVHSPYFDVKDVYSERLDL